MQEKITYDNLPQAVEMLIERLDQLNSYLVEFVKLNNQPDNNDTTILNVEDTAQFLNLKPSTIYSKICKSELPHMKRGKRIYFLKEDLINYLKKGRKITQSELRNNINSKLGSPN
jgi:predicted DNA-binding transcriptional regulator AlpA